MLETVVLEVLAKISNPDRSLENILIGERSAARLGQTQRFEQNGVVLELNPQLVLQDKIFLKYKIFLHLNGKAWTAVAQGSFQADAHGTTQMLVADKRYGNFIDLSVKTFAENKPAKPGRKINLSKPSDGPA